jgi:beta-glucosidase
MSIRKHAAIVVVSLTLCLAVTLLSSVTAQGAEPQAEQVTLTPKYKSVIPAPRIAEWWFARQAEKIGLMSKGDIDLLMVGDSITNNFENEKVGLKVWEKYFVPLKAINLGFGGDRTEHVLWRLDHLPVMKKAPKGAVLMIGTNNMGWGTDTPEQTASGVVAIVSKLKKIYPDMEVLVLGVFPRRQKVDHPHRKRIIQLNAMLPELLKGMKGVKFLDIGGEFLDDKGFLSKEMMPDGTHPSERAHEIWAEAIMPELKKMLGK